LYERGDSLYIKRSYISIVMVEILGLRSSGALPLGNIVHHFASLMEDWRYCIYLMGGFTYLMNALIEEWRYFIYLM